MLSKTSIDSGVRMWRDECSAPVPPGANYRTSPAQPSPAQASPAQPSPGQASVPFVLAVPGRAVRAGLGWCRPAAAARSGKDGVQRAGAALELPRAVSSLELHSQPVITTHHQAGVGAKLWCCVKCEVTEVCCMLCEV